MAVSRIIEAAVNDRFEHVTFRLFKVLLKKEVDGTNVIEPRCDAMFDGIEFKVWSQGERIIGGLEIINALSEHYGVHLPLFVDDISTLTLPLRSASQIIGLRAVEGVNKLQVVK